MTQVTLNFTKRINHRLHYNVEAHISFWNCPWSSHEIWNAQNLKSKLQPYVQVLSHLTKGLQVGSLTWPWLHIFQVKSNDHNFLGFVSRSPKKAMILLHQNWLIKKMDMKGIDVSWAHLALSIIIFGEIKMITWSWSSNSIEPGQTARKCRPAWLYTGGKGFRL